MTQEQRASQLELARKAVEDERRATQAVMDANASWADLAVLRKAADTVLELNKTIVANPT